MERHSKEPRPWAVHQGTGEPIWAMGSLFEVALDGEDTAGRIEIAEVTQPPGIATPLHRHTREDEVFYVLEGELDYEGGGELHHLRAGSTMYLPAGVPHRFRIRGEVPARILAIVTPGGLFDLYRQVGLPAERREIPTDPDPAEFGRWGLWRLVSGSRS